MDFYLTNIASGERLRFPIVPDRISIKTGAMTQSLSIIKTGEVKIPRGTSLTGYSWNGTLPGERLSDYPFVFDWQAPARIVDLLKGWMEKGDTLRLMITDLSINADVFIETFQYEYFGAGDCSYTLSLTVRRELTITTVAAPTVPTVTPGQTEPDATTETKQYGTVTGGSVYFRSGPGTKYKAYGTKHKGDKVEILGKTGNWYIIAYSKGKDGKAYMSAKYIKLNAASGGSGSSSSSGGSKSSGSKKTSTSTSSTGSGDSYTVRSGDSLYAIAKAQLGDGNRWKEIYELNKSAIDAANKGKAVSKYTLTAGISLKLPAKKSTATSKKSSSASVSNVAKAVKSAVSSVVTAAKSLVMKKPSGKVTKVTSAAVKMKKAATTKKSSKIKNAALK